jgi:hypothetical protein
MGAVRAEVRCLDPAIRTALEARGFADLESIRGLPGMTRSVAWALTRVWNADFPLADHAHDSPRLQDLATIDAWIAANLPAGVLTCRPAIAWRWRRAPRDRSQRRRLVGRRP